MEGPGASGVCLGFTGEPVQGRSVQLAAPMFGLEGLTGACEGDGALSGIIWVKKVGPSLWQLQIRASWIRV